MSVYFRKTKGEISVSCDINGCGRGQVFGRFNDPMPQKKELIADCNKSDWVVFDDGLCICPEHVAKLSGTPDKPPIGIKPKFIHDEQRLQELCNAIGRAIGRSKHIPIEWHREYNNLIHMRDTNELH